MFKLKHFKAHEFVDEVIYKKRGDASIELMDKEILEAIDFIREDLDLPVTINNWFWGGKYDGRGYRWDNKKLHPEYSNTSQHSGKAIDFNVRGMSAEQVNNWIIENRNHPKLRAVRFIEMGKSWTHIDSRPTENDVLICWWTDGSTKIHKRD